MSVEPCGSACRQTWRSTQNNDMSDRETCPTSEVKPTPNWSMGEVAMHEEPRSIQSSGQSAWQGTLTHAAPDAATYGDRAHERSSYATGNPAVDVRGGWPHR